MCLDTKIQKEKLKNKKNEEMKIDEIDEIYLLPTNIHLWIAYYYIVMMKENNFFKIVCPQSM